MEQKFCRGCEEPEVDKLPGCPLQCRTVQCKAYKKKPIYDYEVIPIVWVIGGPGSGKRTQCQKIAAMYGFTYLSAGDMIREEMASGSTRTRCLNSVTGRGGLVPNDLVLALLKEAIEKAAAKGTRGFVLDGFPRNKTQGPLFEQAVGPASLILYLEVTISTLFQRMNERPKNSDRIDETPNAIKLRLETFMKHYESIIEFYKYRHYKIHAEKSADETFAEIQIPMDELMANVAALKVLKEAGKGRNVEFANVNEQPAMPKGGGTQSSPERKTKTQPATPKGGSTESCPDRKSEPSTPKGGSTESCPDRKSEPSTPKGGSTESCPDRKSEPSTPKGGSTESCPDRKSEPSTPKGGSTESCPDRKPEPSTPKGGSTESCPDRKPEPSTPKGGSTESCPDRKPETK